MVWKNLGLWSRLKHENGNGLKKCPKTQAHSHKCENVQGNELNTFKWMFTLDNEVFKVFQIRHFNFFWKDIEKRLVIWGERVWGRGLGVHGQCLRCGALCTLKNFKFWATYIVGTWCSYTFMTPTLTSSDMLLTWYLCATNMAHDWWWCGTYAVLVWHWHGMYVVLMWVFL
jgi:hypothetical protein